MSSEQSEDRLHTVGGSANEAKSVGSVDGQGGNKSPRATTHTTHRTGGWSKFHKTATECASDWSAIDTLPEDAVEAVRNAFYRAERSTFALIDSYNKDTDESSAVKRTLILGLPDTDQSTTFQDHQDYLRLGKKTAGIISKYTAADRMPDQTEIWDIASEHGAPSTLQAIAGGNWDSSVASYCADKVRAFLKSLQQSGRRGRTERRSQGWSNTERDRMIALPLP